MKRLSKILSLILTVVMIISAVPMTAAAKTYGDLTYTISNGEVTITDCDESVFGEIIIPDEIDGYPVTSIGKGIFVGGGAFENCDALTSVTIGNSVTSIGSRAFRNCYALTSITVDKNNKNYSSDENGVLFNKDRSTLIQYPIGNARTSYIIPDSVTSIGDEAFWGCGALTSVTIPDSVTSIGDYAFTGCGALTSVAIPDSVTSIGDYAFCNCTSLTNVTIPDSVASIGKYAFSGCYALTSVTIGISVTSIGFYAFSFCSSLVSIIINNPDCEINDTADTIDSSATICGHEGSTAQVYAEKHSREFISIKCLQGQHVYESVVIEPTCISKGYTTYKCICGENYVTDYVDMIEHVWKIEKKIDATCVSEGKINYFCENCDTTKTEIIQATGLHDFGSWVALSDVSCSQDGIKIRICKNCSELEVHNTKASGHIDDDADSRCDDCSCILEFPSVDDEDEQAGEELNAFAGIVEFFKKIFNFIKQLFGMK